MKVTERRILPLVFGIKSFTLSEEEKKLFAEYKIMGIILFSRNIASKTQLLELTSSIKSLYQDYEPLILIDQEGGRVARIKPSVGEKTYPAAEIFADMYLKNGADQAAKAVKENYYELMSELRQFQIDSPCAPVADLRVEGANKVIGDRSFGLDNEQVIALCKAAIEGINAADGISCIKHIPGHGRAIVDSHLDLPVIDTALEELEETDFYIFKQLSKWAKHRGLNASLPHMDIAGRDIRGLWAMTAHVVYNALDAAKPVTLSSKAIEYIRHNIGFEGIIISDDICMHALYPKANLDYKSTKEDMVATSYSNSNIDDNSKITRSLVVANAIEALKAGCDIVLHCSADIEEMRSICYEIASSI